MFKGKVPKAKREDFKSNRSTPLADIFVISSPLKYKARKAFKKFHKNKLKIETIKLLAFNKTKRQKGKVAIIAKADRKKIVRKLQLK